MEGLVDVVLCIDVNAPHTGFNGLRKYLKSPALHKFMHTPTTTDEAEYYKGNRFALVKIDQNGFDVLMHFNDPSPMSKLSTIADEHFKDEQAQTASREMSLKDIFDDIRQTVFAPENGDRVAPNVMIYFYLPSQESDEAFHKELLRYMVDVSVWFNRYSTEYSLRWANLREYGGNRPEPFRFLKPDGSNPGGLHSLVEIQLHQCKGYSMYKYTKCLSTQSTHGTRCVRRKVFKGDAIFPHFCWHGESPVMEPCEKENECIDKCEQYLDDSSACIGPCNSTGKQLKAYRSNPINCTVKVVDCFRLCIHTTTSTAGVSSSDAGASCGVQPAGAIPATPKDPQSERLPGPRTELPQWVKGAIIVCCVISGLVILGVLASSVYMAVRKVKARRESKGQRKPE